MKESIEVWRQLRETCASIRQLALPQGTQRGGLHGQGLIAGRGTTVTTRRLPPLHTLQGIPSGWYQQPRQNTRKTCSGHGSGLACATWQRSLAFRVLGGSKGPPEERKEQEKKKVDFSFHIRDSNLESWTVTPNYVQEVVCPFIFQGRGRIAYIRFIKEHKRFQGPQTDRSQAMHNN